MLDFQLASTAQILTALGDRLRQQRLAAGITQQALAVRAGVALSAVKKVESGANATLQSLVNVVQALSLTGDLSDTFKLKITTSIAEMERAALAPRKRARTPRKP